MTYLLSICVVGGFHGIASYAMTYFLRPTGDAEPQQQSTLTTKICT